MTSLLANGSPPPPFDSLTLWLTRHPGERRPFTSTAAQAGKVDGAAPWRWGSPLHIPVRIDPRPRPRPYYLVGCRPSRWPPFALPPPLPWCCPASGRPFTVTAELEGIESMGERCDGQHRLSSSQPISILTVLSGRRPSLSTVLAARSIYPPLLPLPTPHCSVSGELFYCIFVKLLFA
jgi:hypothetical protein